MSDGVWCECGKKDVHFYSERGFVNVNDDPVHSLFERCTFENRAEFRLETIMTEVPV